MQLTIQSKELSAALDRIKPVCSARSSLPCINCVLLDAQGTVLTLSGSNLDQHLSLESFCEAKQAGAVALSCSELQKTVSLMDGEVAIECDKKLMVSIRQGSKLRIIPGIAPDEMPAKITGEGKLSDPVQFESGALAKLLAKEMPFTCTGDPTRFVLWGICFRGVEGKLTLYATNGRILRRERADLDFSGEFILPPGAASQVCSLFSSEPCELRWSSNCAEIRGDKCCLTTKLIDGKFPEADQVIPPKRELKECSEFGRNEMLEALRFAALEADGAPGKTVRLEASNGDLVVSAAMNGSSRNLVPGAGGFKEPVAFGCHFMTSLVKSFDAERLTLHFGYLLPGLIEDETGTAVIHPIRVS